MPVALKPHTSDAGTEAQSEDGSAFLRVVIETHEDRLEMDTRNGSANHIEARAVEAIRWGLLKIFEARSKSWNL